MREIRTYGSAGGPGRVTARVYPTTGTVTASGTGARRTAPRERLQLRPCVCNIENHDEYR